MNDRYAYHRLETDAEFIARIQRDRPGWYDGGDRGELLDHWAWYTVKMQRRIIFVPAP